MTKEYKQIAVYAHSQSLILEFRRTKKRSWMVGWITVEIGSQFWLFKWRFLGLLCVSMLALSCWC